MLGVRGEAKASPQICDQLTFHVRTPPPLQDSALCMFGRQTNMCAPQPYVGTEKKPLCILFYLPFLQPADVGSERIQEMSSP